MIVTKLISIDTSIFGELTKDYFSKDIEVRSRAKDTLMSLNENGMIPFVTFHHIQELLQHNDDSVVFQRWSLFKAFPNVAWLCSYNDENILGSVFDIHLIEVKSLLESPNSEAKKIKEEVLGKFIKYSKGSDFVARFEHLYCQIREYGLLDNNRSKEIESLSHIRNRDIDNTKLSVLFNAQLRSSSNAALRVELFEGELIKSLKLRGDVKLSDPADIARSFVDDVLSTSELLYESNESLYEAFIKSSGVRLDQVTSKTTVGQLGKLAEYNSKTRHMLDLLGLPREREVELFHDKQVVWNIEQFLDSAMRFEKRAHGSNMQDRYMGVFSIIVDVFTADKRVCEYFRQLSRKKPELDKLFGHIVKIPHYSSLNSLK